jgi:hypothetical protein
LSAGSDRLVKLWNYQGEQRGVLKQGLKENPQWNYVLGNTWENKEKIKYKELKDDLEDAYDQYIIKKRLSVIPFTEEERF